MIYELISPVSLSPDYKPSQAPLQGLTRGTGMVKTHEPGKAASRRLTNPFVQQYLKSYCNEGPEESEEGSIILYVVYRGCMYAAGCQRHPNEAQK